MNGSQQPAAAPAANGVRPSVGSSPAGAQGTTPTGPNGQPRPKMFRRKPQTDPLRPAARPLKKISRPIVPTTQIRTTNTGLATRNNTQPGLPTPDTSIEEMRAQGATVVPLTTTKRALMEGLRHHVMRLQQSHQMKEKGKKVDIFDEAQFVRPIRLHRRDPRAPPSGAGAPIVEEDTKDSLEEDKERERQEIAKEERRRIREENQAKIAPSTTKKQPAFQRRTEQVYRADDTPEAQKRSKLRYEEALPWHLEDFDNKQTWVGTYEGELSESHVLILMEPDGTHGAKARVVPLEKWYKFNAKGKGRAYTAEEADKIWQTTGRAPKFIEKAEQLAVKREREDVMKSKAPGRMRTRIGGRGDDDVPVGRRADDDMPTIKREADADDIDFNMEEDFADDEEGLNGLFEGDEAETKDAEERLKRDQLNARVFDLRDDNEVYKEEEEDADLKEKTRKLEKQFRKSLRKREKNYDYESSDSNKYGSSSSESETDSETERQREKERKEEEEKRAAEQTGKALDGEKIASGASTKGTTTPSGSQKPGELAKPKKRPGSPNLSEASGNESSRKKHKKKHGDRPDASRKSSLVRLSVDPTKLKGAASGSESEMTDTGKKKKLKMKLGRSPSGTPSGSRAGSPDASGSRAGSPLSAGGVSGPRGFQPVTPKEIYEALPQEGITIQKLLTRFKHRVGNNHVFIAMVKAVSDFSKQTGLIMPKPTLPPQADIDLAVKKAEEKAGVAKAPTKA